MTTLARSERFTAVLLLVAAVAGLALANSPVGSGLEDLLARRTHLPAIGIDLTAHAWVSDFLLAIFFLLIATELKHEFTAGELTSVRTAAVPAIAAVGGVVVPAVLYSVLTHGTAFTGGWPIPTATDVAFALGILSVFGRGLPRSVRALLLALAVLDDLIGIVLIAVVFAGGLDPVMLGCAVLSVAAFAATARVKPGSGARRSTRFVLLVILGLITWWCVYRSGIHPTIAGVALGLVLPAQQGRALAARLEPWSNMIVMPLFAFVSAAVVFPSGGAGPASIVFLAVAIALPVGKAIGITLFGWCAARFLGTASGPAAPFSSIVAVGALGGVGFTVSLLMAELAFGHDATAAGQGVLGVLTGSGIAMVASAILVSVLARRARNRTAPH